MLEEGAVLHVKTLPPQHTLASTIKSAYSHVQPPRDVRQRSRRLQLIAGLSRYVEPFAVHAEPKSPVEDPYGDHKRLHHGCHEEDRARRRLALTFAHLQSVQGPLHTRLLTA